MSARQQNRVVVFIHLKNPEFEQLSTHLHRRKKNLDGEIIASVWNIELRIDA